MEVSTNNFDDFLQTGRTGRRNAIPDIEGEKNKVIATGELPLQFDNLKLTCSDTHAIPSINQFNNNGIATTSNHNEFN